MIISFDLRVKKKNCNATIVKKAQLTKRSYYRRSPVLRTEVGMINYRGEIDSERGVNVLTF